MKGDRTIYLPMHGNFDQHEAYFRHHHQGSTCAVTVERDVVAPQPKQLTMEVGL